MKYRCLKSSRREYKYIEMDLNDNKDVKTMDFIEVMLQSQNYSYTLVVIDKSPSMLTSYH